MLALKKGMDILAEVGGIRSLDEARALFEVKCDQGNLAKLEKITNEEALLKIANAIAMTDPDAVFVNTGSDADIRKVREMSLERGEERPLPMKDHTIHFDLAQEQARIIDRTFYIVNEGEETSVLALKILNARHVAGQAGADIRQPLAFTAAVSDFELNRLSISGRPSARPDTIDAWLTLMDAGLSPA